MADPRRRVLAATLLAGLLALTGCTTSTPGDDDKDPGERTTAVPTPTLRTDPAPITKRFPSLGSPAALHWLGGAAGKDTGGVPGPTDVHIQAVVKLAPDVAAAAEKDYRWTAAPAGWETTVPAPLRPHLPATATWQTDEKFTKDVSTASYSGRVYYDKASDTVYLDAIGG